MKNPLTALGNLQKNRYGQLIVLSLVLTATLATGIPKIQLQTDFQASLPDSLDPIQAEDRLEAKFGSTDSVIILYETNQKPVEENYVTDIRNPQVIESQNRLTDALEKEEEISQASSVADLFQKIPENKTQIKNTVQATSAGQRFLNRDYTKSIVFVELASDATEDNVKTTARVVSQNLETTGTPPGTEATITGLPVVRANLGTILVEDSATVTAAASVLILGLLTFVRGRVYGPITFIPLAMGLIWTLGTLGWLGIPLTIATIALGSLILGLGVEYGSFMTERIVEEMEDKTPEKSVKIAVQSTGKAIIGSATTTVVGFAALLLASISFIRNLGLTLALGIMLTVAAAVTVTPTIVIAYNRWKRQ